MAAAGGAVRVTGLREAQRAFRKLGSDLEGTMRKGLEEAAELVAVDARRRLSRYSPVSAAGLEPKVILKAAKVVQKRRRKFQGDPFRWGDLQMREALVPAREAKIDEATKKVEHLLDQMCGRAGF